MTDPGGKALAARNRDIEDLRRLAPLAGVSSVDAAVQLARQFYPDEVMSTRAVEVLRDLFGSGGGGDEGAAGA